MKNIFIFFVCFFFCLGPAVHAQSQEAQQLLLNVAKLVQLRSILTDMKKGYTIVSQGYGAVKSISKGSFDLHKGFLESLLSVSAGVSKYAKVPAIISYQLEIVKEYKSAFNCFRKDQNFTPDEVAYISNVYGNLFSQSLKNLEALGAIVTSGRLRMSDDERLAAIDGIYNDMQDKYIFLRDFNNKASMLSLERVREKIDINVTRKLYSREK